MAFDAEQLLIFLNTNWGAILSIVSLIVATASIFISVWEIISSRKHNFLSVRPYLGTFENIHVNDSGYIIYSTNLSNDGVGPAIIDDFEIYFDGELIAKNDNDKTLEVVEKKIKETYEDAQCNVKSYTKTACLPAGFSQYLLVVSKKFHGEADKRDFKQFFYRFKVRIKYKSMYNKRKVFDSSEYIQI